MEELLNDITGLVRWLYDTEFTDDDLFPVVQSYSRKIYERGYSLGYRVRSKEEIDGRRRSSERLDSKSEKAVDMVIREIQDREMLPFGEYRSLLDEG